MNRYTNLLNKYQIKALALSDMDINYDKFYKDEVIKFCVCLREEYKKCKTMIDNAKNKAIDVQKNYGCILDDLIVLLSENEE